MTRMASHQRQTNLLFSLRGAVDTFLGGEIAEPRREAGASEKEIAFARYTRVSWQGGGFVGGVGEGVRRLNPAEKNNRAPRKKKTSR